MKIKKFSMQGAPQGCTQVCKCMLPKQCLDDRKVDKAFRPRVMVVGGETEEG